MPSKHKLQEIQPNDFLKENYGIKSKVDYRERRYRKKLT